MFSNRKRIIITANCPQIYLGLIMISLSFNFNSLSQIPEKAKLIADSVSMTRLLCPNTNIYLQDSILYPIFENSHQSGVSAIYYFKYTVKISHDVESELSFSIFNNLEIRNISGVPDSSFKPSYCEILNRRKLWRIARKRGLKTGFKKCNYSLIFKENMIKIVFHESKESCNTVKYIINAITGEFLQSEQRMQPINNETPQQE